MQAVLDLLNDLHPELELTAEEFSGCMFKRLTTDSSIAVPLDQDHGHNYHLPITGQNGPCQLFPSVTTAQYLTGDQTYKRSAIVMVDTQLFDVNLRILFERCVDNYNNLGYVHNPEVTVESLNNWINDLNGENLLSIAPIAYRRSRQQANGPYNNIQLEAGDSDLEGRDFKRLRRVLGPDDYIVFLRHADDPMMYSVFGVPSETDLGEIPDGPVYCDLPGMDFFPEGYTIPANRLRGKPNAPEVNIEDFRYTLRSDGFTALNHVYRLPESIALVANQAQPDTNPEFNPNSTRSAVRRLWRRVRQRRGQRQFRNRLRQRYGDQCQMSGCHVMRAVQAAHIQPYDGDETNNTLNGILLRSDIHVLFDEHLIQLHIGEDDVVRVWVDDSLDGTEYECYRDNELILNDSDGPSHEAIQWRNGNLIREYEDAGISLEEE